MKTTGFLKASFLSAALLAAAAARADYNVTVDPATLTSGYMNVFNLPSAGGAYQFGSGWGTADLSAKFSGSTLTLGPNTIGDPASYWYTPAGGPGAVGNKVMDANFYNETTGTYVGTTLTFSGLVAQNTLAGQVAPNGVTWSTVAFIKDFDAGWGSVNTVTAPLTPGPFSISLATSVDPTHHIQYGFEVMGSDVWLTDVGQYGTVVLNPVPEPSALGLGIVCAALLILRRRQS